MDGCAGAMAAGEAVLGGRVWKSVLTWLHGNSCYSKDSLGLLSPAFRIGMNLDHLLCLVLRALTDDRSPEYRAFTITHEPPRAMA